MSAKLTKAQRGGITALAELSGLSTAEIRWTFDRLKHLMQGAGRTRDEAKEIVRREAAARPWEYPAAAPAVKTVCGAYRSHILNGQCIDCGHPKNLHQLPPL